jgi:hypothetical protein
MIDRRRFLMTSLACVLASRLTVDAQPTGKVYRVGWLSIGAPYWKDSPLADAFRQGLREQGWREGQTLTIEYRWAHDDPRRLPGLAKELVEPSMLSSRLAATLPRPPPRTQPVPQQPKPSGYVTATRPARPTPGRHGFTPGIFPRFCRHTIRSPRPRLIGDG